MHLAIRSSRESRNDTPHIHIAHCTAATLNTYGMTIQLSAQPSTPVPLRPLPVCLQCRFQTTSSLCQPRSSRRASPSSQQLWSADFFSVAGPATWNWLPDSLRDPAISRDSFKRSLKTFFIFSLFVCVAH